MESSSARMAGNRWQAFMDAAADCVQRMAREDDDGEAAACARSVLQTPASWNRWERELGAALRPVANGLTRTRQLQVLRRANFVWVHRAAPFCYLRKHAVRGAQRVRLIRAMHGPFAHYDLAVVAEHERYQRSVCHGFCAVHLGTAMLGDTLYGKSMRRYEALYMEYFRTFGELTCGKAGPAAAQSHQRLLWMKRQLADMRHGILEEPRRGSWLLRPIAMRASGSNIQLLRRPDQDPD